MNVSYRLSNYPTFDSNPGPMDMASHQQQRTSALVTTSSTSPRCAPIRTPNFSTTPPSTPNRLFSASVARKFLTMPSLSWLPMCFCSSWTICCLSETDSEGACRISLSLASFLNTLESVSSDLAVGSRALVFAAAVYCGRFVSPAHSVPLPRHSILLHRYASNCNSGIRTRALAYVPSTPKRATGGLLAGPVAAAA
jgi:hypothetical protein